MNRCKNEKGFTMAELMLAVAIIIILGALAMVGVTRYLRSMRLMEMDNAAKELFFAAQNRITAELNSGTLGRLDAKQMETDAENAKAISGVEYMVRFPDKVNGKTDSTLWDELLPFGSIDDTIRTNGFYIITYSLDIDANLATVLDVWYTSDDGSGFFRNWDRSEDALRNASYKQLTDARVDGNKNNRLKFPDGNGNAVIGHYGGTGVTLSRSELAIKEFQLINKEELYLTGTVERVKGTITLDQVKVNIIVEGRKSGAKKIVTLDQVTDAASATEGYDPNSNSNSGKFLFVLDDITTADKRFNKRFSTDADGKKFIPGEDIQVTVEVYSNDVLANIDRATAVDNSLFQYVKQSTESNITTAEAGIGNFRHLQNLSSAVSGVELGVKDATHANRLGINSALQTTDLKWTKSKPTDPSESKGFAEFERPVLFGTSTSIGGNIYYNEGNTINSFFPIDIDPKNTESFEKQFGIVENEDEKPKVRCFLYYDAGYTGIGTSAPEKHKISNLKVSGVNNAGLFGSVGTNESVVPQENNDTKEYLLSVKNLDMSTATITGDSAAGTVAATVQRATMLTNVSISDATVTISENKTGNVGGAVGESVNGLNLVNVSVTEANVSTDSGNAGGLLGEHSGTKVHLTISGCSVTNSTTDKPVTGTTAAGGLVGSITNGIPTITNSYSTAIVSGNVAGGLVGTVAECGDGSEIKSCYVGGHVVNQTEPTKEKSQPVIYSSTDFNVTATANTGIAGGFIGSIDAAAGTGLTVEACYSTASASADLAGGFIGQLSGDGAANYSVSNCYAVGLVNDTTTGVTAENPDRTLSGAFVGNLADVNILAGNRYFELVNENMHAVGNIENPAGVIAAETSLETYNNFFSFGVDKEFSPYNDRLKTMFGTRYFLPTVKDLGGDDSMNTHVGDWQPVDTLVFNTKSSTPTEP